MHILKSFRRARFKACNNYQNLVSWSIVVKDPNKGLKIALVRLFLRVPQSAEQVKILIFLVKVRVQISGIDTIKYHTWPRIPTGK